MRLYIDEDAPTPPGRNPARDDEAEGSGELTEMDIAGIKSLFGQRVLASADKQFVGTLEPIVGSQDTVTLKALDAADANNYPFAINGVTALSVSAITFIQKLT